MEKLTKVKLHSAVELSKAQMKSIVGGYTDGSLCACVENAQRKTLIPVIAKGKLFRNNLINNIQLNII